MQIYKKAGAAEGRHQSIFGDVEGMGSYYVTDIRPNDQVGINIDLPVWPRDCRHIDPESEGFALYVQNRRWPHEVVSRRRITNVRRLTSPRIAGSSQSHHTQRSQKSFLPGAACQRPILEVPAFRPYGLSELNRSQQLLSWAFPTLYPYGLADFLHAKHAFGHMSRYPECLSTYKNGRFARRPRWRFVIFNTLMRQLSLVSKLMNKLVGERDWSAQALSHLLLNLPLQQGSRQVISVDCHREDLNSIIILFFFALEPL